MISRVKTTLINLHSLIKLSYVGKTQLLSPSRPSVIKYCPGAFQIYQTRGMSSDLEKELNDPKRHLDYNQLVERKDKENVILIDVREHSEVKETGKIPGSIHIPLNELSHALNDMPSEEFLKLYNSTKPKADNEVIFTCRSGKRSLMAMKLAELREALSDMPEEEFNKAYGALKPKKDSHLIFSCKGGGRSFKALKLALELGYKNAENYKGGWLDWADKTKSSS